jgi:hypothetical protein
VNAVPVLAGYTAAALRGFSTADGQGFAMWHRSLSGRELPYVLRE